MIRVEPELYEDLVAWAIEEHTNLSALIRETLRYSMPLKYGSSKK